jgi:hypothetical protein
MEIRVLPPQMLSLGKELLVEAYARGYRITRDGQLISPSRKNPVGGYINTTGYRETGLPFKGRNAVKLLFHRLQAYQKFGDAMFEEGIEVRHLNGNPLDNSFDNIAIGTQSENSMDKKPEVRKRAAKIAASKQKKLTETEVVELKTLRKQGWKYADLMVKFGLAKSTVSYIVNDKTYQD